MENKMSRFHLQILQNRIKKLDMEEQKAKNKILRAQQRVRELEDMKGKSIYLSNSYTLNRLMFSNKSQFLLYRIQSKGAREKPAIQKVHAQHVGEAEEVQPRGTSTN